MDERIGTIHLGPIPNRIDTASNRRFSVERQPTPHRTNPDRRAEGKMGTRYSTGAPEILLGEFGRFVRP
jgi:hypothetical protein